MIFSKEIAYSIDVPEKVMPTAKIRKIGGMTRKCANLIPFPYGFSSGSQAGVTVTVNNDGGVTYNGTATTQINPYFASGLLLPKGTYTLSGAPKGASWTTQLLIVQTDDFSTILAEDYGNGSTFTLDADTVVRICLIVANGATCSNITIYPMLNAGSTALPYEPYFEGLRSAKVTEVKSVGVNLFGGDVLADKLVEVYKATKDEISRTVMFDASQTIGADLPFSSFKENTQYTFVFYGKNPTSHVGNLAIFYTDGTNKQFNFSSANKDDYIVGHSDAGKTVNFLCGVASTGNTILYYDKCGVFEGVLSLDDFKPYVEHTLPIPEAVRPANGINENVYDYIEWAEDGSVKKTVKCGVVDLGTLNWYYGDLYGVGINCLYTYGLKDAKLYGSINTPNAACAIYNSITPREMSLGESGITLYDALECVAVSDSNYTDAAIFKSAMSGVMLVYELAEPIVTDISDLITADNLIGVEGGGTLTFENEHKLAVPIEVEYTRASIENYGRLIVDNLKKIGNYLGVQSDPQSTTNILTGMDSSALKSTNSSNPARSSDILLNREAYVNGVKVVGSLELEAEEIVPDGYYDTSDATISVESILKGYVGYGKSGRMMGTYEPPSYVERDSDDLFDGEENGCIVLNVPYGLYRDGAKWVLPREVVYTSLAIGEFPISADFVAEGLVGYVNGERIEGNLPFRQEEDIAVSVSNGNIRAEVPRGYYNEDYSVDLKGKYIDTTVLDVGATSSDIAAGKVAFVNGTLITGDATVRSDSDLTLKIADGHGNVSVEVPNGIYYDHISKIFEDTSTFKLRNTAYKLEGDFASSSKLLRGYVAYANGEMLYGSIDSNGSDAITTDVVDGKVTVNVSAGYYDGDMTHELPDTMADVFDASEVDPLEIPKGLVVYGLGETKLEGLYTKYYANKVTGNADVFKSTDISIRPTLFDDGRYGMALYDGFYSDARAILPSTNWVDTSAGDLYAITEDLIPSSYVGYVDGKKIIGSMAYNTGDSVHIGISNNTTLSPTTVTVSVTVDKGFYEIDTPKSLTLRPGIVDSAVLPYGATVFADNTAILKGRAAYANGKVLVGTMDYYAYGYGYSVERNAGGKRVNYVVERGYHEGGASILDDVIMYTDGENGTLYSHSNENDDDGLWYSNALAKGITACANGEVIHGTSTYYYGKSLFIDFTDPVIPDGIYSDSRVYIPGGFVDTSDATISAVRYGDTWISEHVVSGKTVYARGVKVIGTRPSEDTLTWYDGDFGVTILDDETTYVIELYDRSDLANNRTMATVYTSVNPTIYDNGIVYLKDPYDPNTLRAFMIVVDRTNNNPTLMLYHVLSAFPDELYEVGVSGYGYRYARISIH